MSCFNIGINIDELSIVWIFFCHSIIHFLGLLPCKLGLGPVKQTLTAEKEMIKSTPNFNVHLHCKTFSFFSAQVKHSGVKKKTDHS